MPIPQVTSVVLADFVGGSGMASRCEVVITFTSKLRDGAVDPRGVYTCPGGRVATHFEVSHARTAFPCPDDPKIRLAWLLSVSVPETYSVLSNGAISSTKSSTGGLTLRRHGVHRVNKQRDAVGR